jgi:hypothetical protein
MLLLKMGDGLDVVDHESTTGQGDGKRLGDGVVGHIDMIPRLSSRSKKALSARVLVHDARNTWYVVVGISSRERGIGIRPRLRKTSKASTGCYLAVGLEHTFGKRIDVGSVCSTHDDAFPRR